MLERVAEKDTDGTEKGADGTDRERADERKAKKEVRDGPNCQSP